MGGGGEIRHVDPFEGTDQRVDAQGLPPELPDAERAQGRSSL